jgi:hypothetical protein
MYCLQDLDKLRLRLLLELLQPNHCLQGLDKLGLGRSCEAMAVHSSPIHPHNWARLVGVSHAGSGRLGWHEEGEFYSPGRLLEEVAGRDCYCCRWCAIASSVGEDAGYVERADMGVLHPLCRCRR